jgi:multicomponent Na+:H+ antiporter subunit A
MLGVVFSDDVFVLFVFWELTSIASYLLIGFKHDKQEARDAARQALLVTGAGGLALLAGLVLLTIAASQAGLSIRPGVAHLRIGRRSICPGTHSSCRHCC